MQVLSNEKMSAVVGGEAKPVGPISNQEQGILNTIGHSMYNSSRTDGSYDLWEQSWKATFNAFYYN